MKLTHQDHADLKQAHALIESEPFIIRVSNVIGKPITFALEKLPGNTTEIVVKATNKSLDMCLQSALATMTSQKKTSASNWFHKMLVAGTGGLGGFWGLPALAIELPVTTGIMLRSIADIARSEGENLSDAETQLACISVFGLEGGKKSDDDSDTGFYASRIAIAKMVKAAAEYLAKSTSKKVGEKTTATVLVKLLQQISSRFSITVSEKAAAQALPFIGAAIGATINTLFMDYYQDMARGHFILRRLERKYSTDFIRSEYEKLG